MVKIEFRFTFIPSNGFLMAKVAKDNSTEEKIKAAARTVFSQKGYAATRTRDIAEAAGINLALLSYYFRSKEKLFALIMQEKVQQLFGSIIPVLIESGTTLEEKIRLIVARYSAMLVNHPDLPLFVLSEIRNHPAAFMEMTHIQKVFKQSDFIRQLKEANPEVQPVHFLMNILGMILMPFVGMPVFKLLTGKTDSAYLKLIEQRKELVPGWVMAMIRP